jgi:polyphosphate kinase
VPTKIDRFIVPAAREGPHRFIALDDAVSLFISKLFPATR